ncbi:MAG: hybrid sensor histidine kinase/response regulator [Bacteroidetes bacterium]|nr:hybrid sensor histidine kinase/response regulator [Bacteroidota bacterium]
MMNNNLKKHTVLMVDDNPTNLNVLLDALKHHGFKLLAAKSGEEAIQRALFAKPDLILLDVLMPGIDGFETCRQLKANPVTEEIPIIFMTALADTVDKVKGFSFGAVDYITKPFQHEEVLSRVNAHLTIQDLKRNLEQKNAEMEEKNRLLDEALKHEKELNRLKTGLVGMASHELRRPLTVISLYSRSLFPKENGNAPEQNEGYTKIQKSIRQMTQLLDDILLATQSEMGKLTFEPEVVNLGELCSKIVQESELIDDSAHSLHFTVKNNAENALVDPRLIQRIISNLLSNAVKYSPHGSNIWFDLNTQVAQATFIVKDEGIGISPEDQQKLFENFQRGSNVGKTPGTGLGLTIVKQCVELHNGTMMFSSELGKGTTFEVSLPIDVKIENMV